MCARFPENLIGNERTFYIIVMMKHTTRNSFSKQETNEPKRPHPWLLKHYQEKRQRTIMLVKASVNHLVDEGQTVTLEAICRTSLALDPAGRGVKKSAILENTACSSPVSAL